MSDNTKKGHPILTILVLLSWFLIFLPSIKLFLGDLFFPSYEYSLFEETENELAELIREEKAVFPDEFIPLTSNWQSYDTDWTSNWHIYRPWLYISIYELENLDSGTISAPGGKKSTKSKISHAEFWAIVYKIIISNNKNRLTNLAYAFSWFQEKNELSDRETLEIIIDFIQQIPYEIPDNYYGLYSPAEVLYLNAGDCDSKTLFAALILKQLGYDTALFYSNKYAHVMLGLNVPSTGEYIELNGRPYYFTEMTAPGWQIGEISPDCADLKYWYIVSM
jgi:hypothetical protein